ncbi:MAG: hypothetical protein P8X89_11165 [Reinekea sp.]
MTSVNVLETPIRHGLDLVELFDGSGCTSVGIPARLTETPRIRLTSGPKSLSLTTKPGALVLKSSALDDLYEEGRAGQGDMKYPANVPVAVQGTVESPSGRYNPRFFELTVGNAVVRSLTLFRSVKATEMRSAGAVIGNLVSLVDGSPVVEAWAKVSLVVTPTVGTALTFVAQADARGDFVIPVNRAPALDKDAPSSEYSATLSVQRMALDADSRLPNPASLSALEIESSTSADSFAASLSFKLTPGSIKQLVSANRTSLLVRPA